MARLGLPRAYFDELDRQIEGLPDGIVGPPIEPSTLRMSRVERAHRRAAHRCFCMLSALPGPASGGAWWIEIEPDIRLPGDLLGVPDIAGWRVEEPAAERAGLPGAAPMEDPPTFCCKVIAADMAKNYRDARLPFYARAGVSFFWLIDPTSRSVEVLENAGGEFVAIREARGADEPMLPPFDKRIKLASWWLR